MLQNFNYQVNGTKIQLLFLCARKYLTFFSKKFKSGLITKKRHFPAPLSEFTTKKSFACRARLVCRAITAEFLAGTFEALFLPFRSCLFLSPRAGRREV
jgi:hypothetical protein